VTRTTIAAQRGQRLPQTPEHQAALWLDYGWQSGLLKGLSLGGGARHLSGAYGDTAGVFAVPATTLFDAALRYDLGALAQELQGFRLAVNASNIGDEVDPTCISVGECYWGARRLVLGTLSYRW
jgi:iron complex outermembrane receptor protein